MRIKLRCTLPQSVLSGFTCVQHDMLRTEGEQTDSQLGADTDLGLSLDTTDTCIVHKKKKGIARQPKLTSRKGEKQQRRRDAPASGKEQPRQ